VRLQITEFSYSDWLVKFDIIIQIFILFFSMVILIQYLIFSLSFIFFFCSLAFNLSVVLNIVLLIIDFCVQVCFPYYQCHLPFRQTYLQLVLVILHPQVRIGVTCTLDRQVKDQSDLYFTSPSKDRSDFYFRSPRQGSE
jgi:hypothetical protein